MRTLKLLLSPTLFCRRFLFCLKMCKFPRPFPPLHYAAQTTSDFIGANVFIFSPVFIYAVKLTEQSMVEQVSK